MMGKCAYFIRFQVVRILVSVWRPPNSLCRFFMLILCLQLFHLFNCAIYNRTTRAFCHMVLKREIAPVSSSARKSIAQVSLNLRSFLYLLLQPLDFEGDVFFLLGEAFSSFFVHLSIVLGFFAFSPFFL